jgi:hypothetical protein
MGVMILVLLIFGAVCFLLGTANVASRVNLVALGLLLWILSVLIPAAWKH